MTEPGENETDEGQDDLKETSTADGQEPTGSEVDAEKQPESETEISELDPEESEAAADGDASESEKEPESETDSVPEGEQAPENDSAPSGGETAPAESAPETESGIATIAEMPVATGADAVRKQGNGYSYDSTTGILEITSAAGLSTWYTSKTDALDDDDKANVTTLVIHPTVKCDIKIDKTKADRLGELENIETIEISNVKTLAGDKGSLTKETRRSLPDARYIEIHDVDTIDKYSFYEFKEGAEVYIKDCGTISEQSFCHAPSSGPNGEGLDGLTKVTIDNVAKIDQRSFTNNTDMTSLTIQNGPANGMIGMYAFYGCTGLQEIHFDMANYTIKRHAFDNTGHEGVVLELTGLDNVNLTYCDFLQYAEGELKETLYNRMLALMDGKFTLSPTEKDAEVPEIALGMESSELGEMNAPQGTNLTKAAKWTNPEKTEAEVQLRFNYAEKPGHDFLFVLDYSDSLLDTASGYQDSGFFNIQSKVLDVAEELLDPDNGYDNQVGIVTFASEEQSSQTLDFTGDFETVSGFINEVIPPHDTSTKYSVGLKAALDMLKNHRDRETGVIFISDGQPAQKDDILYNPTREQIIKELGADIYVVYQGSTTIVPELIKNLASDPKLFFPAHNGESFSQAVNDAIEAAHTNHTLADTIDPAYELIDGSINVTCGTYSVAQENGNTVITWNIDSDAFTTDTMTYSLRLKATDTDPENASGYPFGSFDTNEGYVELSSVPSFGIENRVASPQLTRAGKRVTVNYLEQGTGNVLAESVTKKQLLGTEYDVAAEAALEIEGYNRVAGEYPSTGTLNGDVVINVYYTKIPAKTYTVTVEYRDRTTDEEIQDAKVTVFEENASYDVSADLDAAIEGYTREDGQTFDNASGVLTGDIVITVYYTRDAVPTTPTNPGGGGNDDDDDDDEPYRPGPTITIPDNQTPMASIEDNQVPLGAEPASGTVLILDEEVPMSAVPETGDESRAGAFLGLFAAVGLLVLAVLKRRSLSEE